MVPTAGGEISLPKQTLHWWNVTKDRLESLTLPGRTWRVAGAAPQAPAPTSAGDTAALPSTSTNATTVTNVADKANANASDRSEAEAQTRGNQLPLWVRVAFGFLGCLLLASTVTIAVLYRKLQKGGAIQATIDPNTIANNSTAYPASWQKARDEAISRAKKKDYARLTQALINWGRLYWSNANITALGHLIKACEDKDLRAELTKLEQFRYQPGQQNPPELSALITALKLLKSPKQSQESAKKNSTPSAPYLAPLQPAS
jgi:hypothetical protein